MFEFIRNHRRWMQVILLILVVPSFVFVGAQGYDTFMSNEPEVAVVDETPITQAEFDAARRNILEERRQSMGARFELSRVDTPTMRSQLLDQLINQRLLQVVARDNRFTVSDESLRNTIASIPAVQDNGQFSPERYRQVLAAQGMTPASFEANVRADLAVRRVIEPVSASAHVPASVMARLDSALTQIRTVQTRRFAAADYKGQVQVSDADVKTWYDAHQDQLAIPESVDAQYLLLDESAATQGVTVSAEQIQQYYDQNKQRFGKAERRRASHIMIEVPSGASADVREAARKKADALATQAKATPDNFAALAREQSQDAGSAAAGGDLGWVGNGVLPPALEAAVKGLTLDQVSDVVDSPSGFHVLKLTALEPGEEPPLDTVRETITEELRKQFASARFADMATQLMSVVNDQRDSLEPAARATGLTVRQANGVARDALLPAEEVGDQAASASPDARLLDSPRVREALFSSEVRQDKLNSGVIELAADRMLVVRVAESHARRVPELAKVESRIRDILIGERSAAAAREAGEAWIKSLQADTSASLDAFSAPQDISRQEPGDLDPAVGLAVLSMPMSPVPAYQGTTTGPDFVVVRLDKVAAGQPAPALLDELGRQAEELTGESEDRAVIQMLRQQYNVKVLPLADQLIKGEPTPQG